MRRVFVAFAASALATCLLPVTSPGATAPADPSGVIRYDLDIQLGPSSMTVDGKMRIAVPSGTGEETFTTSNTVSAMHAAVVVDGTERPATVDVSPDGSQRKSWTFRYRGSAVGADSPLVLHVHYDASGDARFVYSLGPDFALADGADTAWYPQRKQETRGVGTLRVHVAPPRVVVASGVETDTDDDRRAGTFTFRVDAPANFTFAAAPFTVLRAPRGSPLKAYVLRDRADASAYLASCARVFSVLQDEFGPDPYGAFSVVEVPDAVAAAANFGGASSAGVILASSSFLNAPFNVAYFGHEISHQWWGNSVQVEGGSDEAMAQFGSLEVVRRLEGAASAERYRRTGYPGYVPRQDARGYFEFAAAGTDQPLANLDVGGAAHDIGDSKGFLVYDLLARETGRQRFRRNLRRITAAARSKALAVKELVYGASAGGPVDVVRFWNQWFERTGAPSFSLHWHRDGNAAAGDVAQAYPAYDADVPVEVTGAHGESATRSVPIRGMRTSFRFTVPFAPTGVRLDPHYEVLRHTPEFDLRGQALANINRGRNAMSYSRLDDASAHFHLALEQPRMPQEGEVKFLAHYFLAQIAARRHEWSSVRTLMKQAASDRVRVVEWMPYVYLAIVRADVALGDTAGAAEAAAAARAADRAIGGAAGITDDVDAALKDAPKPSPAPSSSPVASR